MYTMIKWGFGVSGWWYIEFEINSGSDYGADLDCRLFPDRESREAWATAHGMELEEKWRRDRRKIA